ncbi:hypothetical protein B0A55_08827 [Friedmanniomyces simplex]|uniref:Uncharacterized protein n=1 Tax=Friedmanniomyces simplex TaxID=329884 RepID=A0A4U0X266_9PEZI|nr:hypothetical protein B0A55_08827 [Friedmanniomyces simplex]
MPTYHATGVSASLSVANLQASSSNVFDLRMSAEQRLDAERIENVFASGRNLAENTIGHDGGEEGVVQFVGHNEDLPLFMVEVGDGLSSLKTDDLDGPGQEDHIGGPVGGLLGATTDSSLTSLNATPSAGDAEELQQSPQRNASTRRPAKKARLGPAAPSSPLASFSDFERARAFLDADPDEPQALCLTVQTNHKSFLPKGVDGTRRSGKDLKLEVFLNGDLVASSLINTRGSAVELKDDRVRFHGTRVHRQSERPWTYKSAATAGDQQGRTATERWEATSRALENEAHTRGRNRWGDIPPSAELLLALSRQPLPERMGSQHGLAVFDLVITAGSGKKYGPETAYLIAPTRMDDPEYDLQVGNGVGYAVGGDPDPFAEEDAMLFGMSAQDASPLRGLSIPIQLPREFLQIAAPEVSPFRGVRDAALSRRNVPQQSSPEAPLMRQRRSATDVPQTPSKKQRVTDAPGLELDGVDLNMKVGSFETARGKTGHQRTLRQRLSDIKQMNPRNRAKQIAALREELDENTLRAIKRAAVRRYEAADPMQASPSTKAKLDVDGCDWEAALNMLADAALAGQDGTIDPLMMNRHSELAPAVRALNMDAPVENRSTMKRRDRLGLAQEYDSFSYEPAAEMEVQGPQNTDSMTQDRMDFALESGSGFHGPAISTFPEQHGTPQKKTRASSLANSPCAVPIKSPTKRGRMPTGTPQRSSHSESTYHPRIGSPFPIDPILAAESPSPSPQKSGQGAKRTRKAWNPGEKTLSEALAEAEKGGELGKGSVVGYASQEGGKQRQIGKARSGIFREESVVVGMRFVVT